MEAVDREKHLAACRFLSGLITRGVSAITGNLYFTEEIKCGGGKEFCLFRVSRDYSRHKARENTARVLIVEYLRASPGSTLEEDKLRSGAELKHCQMAP